MRNVAGLVLCALLLGFPIPATAQDTTAETRIRWWREARFGMFIHWRLYAIPGRGEWVQWNEQIPVAEYAKLANQFKPDNFDANAWAKLANDAGMKYTVLYCTTSRRLAFNQAVAVLRLSCPPLRGMKLIRSLVYSWSLRLRRSGFNKLNRIYKIYKMRRA